MFEASPFDTMPEIETESLLLRRMEMRDAQDMYEYSRDPLVAKHVLWDAHTSVSDTKSYLRYMLRKYRAGEPSSWCIVEKSTGKVVGTIGYMWYQKDNSACEVGYSLARRCWNRGYMTQALNAVLDYTFRELGINRVEAQHETDNGASGAVMRKCGMTKEGTLRSRLYNKGRYVDVDLYSILRKEYMSRIGRKA
ncbi:MAG: GNAT family N-acetyltransferase [Clostridia bacterium]|jgi:Acetyltransferases, including N-acetylases of ribosomal proteins|nr:GNAT family N-acetyltransferase [Clostridia bacterium]